MSNVTLVEFKKLFDFTSCLKLNMFYIFVILLYLLHVLIFELCA